MLFLNLNDVGMGGYFEFRLVINCFLRFKFFLIEMILLVFYDI